MKLNNTQKIVLHTLFYHYVKRHFGLRTGTPKRVLDEFAKTKDLADELKNAQRHGDSPISDDTMRAYLLRARSPEEPKARVYVKFMELKQQLSLAFFNNLSDPGDTIPEQWAAPLSIHRSNLDSNCGSYLHEGSGAKDTIFGFLVLSPPKSRQANFGINLFERFYRLGDDETGGQFQERINVGDYNAITKSLGHVINLNGHMIVSVHSGNERGFLQRRLLAFFINGSPDQPPIILSDYADEIKRRYEKIGGNIKLDGKYYVNLTDRQIKNIIIESKRFLQKSKEPKRRFMRLTQSGLPLTELDTQFLEAVSRSDAVAMVEALADGANINSRDPKTGWTALHWVAKNINVSCLAILFNQTEDLTAVYELLADNGRSDIPDIDLTVRRAIQELNPLIMDNESRFASNLIKLEMDPKIVSKNPYLRLCHDVFQELYWLEHDALGKAGYDPSLNLAPVQARQVALSDGSFGSPQAPEI